MILRIYSPTDRKHTLGGSGPAGLAGAGEGVGVAEGVKAGFDTTCREVRT